MSDTDTPAAPPPAPAPIDLRPLHDAWEQAKADLEALKARVAAELAAAEARVEAAHAAFVAPVAPGAVLSTAENPPPVTIVLGGQAAVVTPYFLGAYTPPAPSVVAGGAGATAGTGG